MSAPPIPPFVATVGSIRRSFSAEKIQSFEYDFTKDGGALGTYKTGIKIPFLSIFTLITYRIITGVTSGGIATINIGWAGNLGAIDSVSTPLPFGANVVKTLSGIPTSLGFEILFTITMATITAGKFVVALQYIDEPLN